MEAEDIKMTIKIKRWTRPGHVVSRIDKTNKVKKKKVGNPHVVGGARPAGGAGGVRKS